jgi:hypothetical protein
LQCRLAESYLPGLNTTVRIEGGKAKKSTVLCTFTKAVHGEKGRARIHRLVAHAALANRYLEMSSGNPMFEQGGVVLLVDLLAAFVMLHDVPLDVRR